MHHSSRADIPEFKGSGAKSSLQTIIRVFSDTIKDPSCEEEFYDLFLHDSITWATVFVGKTKESMVKNGKHTPFSTHPLLLLY